MGYSVRQKLGAALVDWPRFEARLGSSWLEIRNRREALRPSPDRRGYACEWPWTSDLHVAKVFPSLGARLLQRSLVDWPIEFANVPAARGNSPQVAFILGHRGRDRVPQLMATLATIAAQTGVESECIVVEQSTASDIRELLPSWVRHIHTPLPSPSMPYCRAWALNVGARAARGELLVFHDNDMLVPRAYAAEAWSRFREGFETINLKRFVFYLGKEDSQRIGVAHALERVGAPESVVQNLEAGGSVAAGRAAFLAIGGFDESFVGWGGEDNEFWERAQLRNAWPYGYLPIVHLWHAPQPRKTDPANPTTRHYEAQSAISASVRAGTLAARDFGNPHRLSVPWVEGDQPAGTA